MLSDMSSKNCLIQIISHYIEVIRLSDKSTSTMKAYLSRQKNDETTIYNENPVLRIYFFSLGVTRHLL